MGKRAEQREETRRRIVEAALHLHITLGPAQTTISQIAERAGVQRHTFYAHFPDERSLFLACSGLAMERDPLPDFSEFLALPPGHERVVRGLGALYGWFERNAQLSASVLRDAQYHALTREMVELRMAPALQQAAELISEGLAERSRILLGAALDYGCWRVLSETLSPEAAGLLMADAIVRVVQP